MSDLGKSFTPILEIFRQATGRVKGGGLCRRSEPLTRTGACRNSLDRSEARSHCGISICERSRRSIGEGTMWPELVVVSQTGTAARIQPGAVILGKVPYPQAKNRLGPCPKL
jgi:hypothetical protein